MNTIKGIGIWLFCLVCIAGFATFMFGTPGDTSIAIIGTFAVAAHFLRVAVAGTIGKSK